MEEEIFKFLSKYITLTEEQKRIVSENSFFQFFPAGTELLREGQYANACYFVIKGVVRSYYLMNGEEKITDFYTEIMPITPVSYTTGEASNHFISCVEDCVLTVSNKETSQEFLELIPGMKDIGLQIMTELNAKQQVSADYFKILDPEQRYAKFLETAPDLVNRVPQYMIASYLGIQPQSLSRIRKRIRDQRG